MIQTYYDDLIREVEDYKESSEKTLLLLDKLKKLTVETQQTYEDLRSSICTDKKMPGYQILNKDN